jgi:hypothetical protein
MPKHKKTVISTDEMVTSSQTTISISSHARQTLSQDDLQQMEL